MTTLPTSSLPPHRRRQRPTRALTLLEAIITVVVLSFIALAAGTALQALVRVPTQNDLLLAISNKLVDKMEDLRARGFDNLPLGSSLSDTTTINARSYARTVTIAQASGNQDGTPNADFKQITITCAGHSLTTYLAKTN